MFTGRWCRAERLRCIVECLVTAAYRASTAASCAAWTSFHCSCCLAARRPPNVGENAVPLSQFQGADRPCRTWHVRPQVMVWKTNFDRHMADYVLATLERHNGGAGIFADAPLPAASGARASTTAPSTTPRARPPSASPAASVAAPAASHASTAAPRQPVMTPPQPMAPPPAEVYSAPPAVQEAYEVEVRRCQA